MRLEIDIPEHHYNNIMALDSVCLGRAPYKGIIMYAINAIKQGKVLEQEPTIKKDCNTCTHGDETDGSNCYECVKDMCNNYDPTTKNDLVIDCISRDSAIKALDYDIKFAEFKPGISEYMDDIAKLLDTIYEIQVNNLKELPSVTPQHSSELEKDSKKLEKDISESDCVSRADVLKLMQDNWHTHNGDWAMQESMDDIRALPPVTPQKTRKDEVILTNKEYRELISNEYEHGYSKGYAEALEEQEPVIDKIRAEIASLSNANPSYWHSGDMVDRDDVLEIIDKYKAENNL